MVNLDGITSKPAANGEVTLTRKCPFCGKEHSVTVKQEPLLLGMNALSAGALVQDAFPSFNADEREFILTGICPECWDNM